jgi:hypothetical protein
MQQINLYLPEFQPNREPLRSIHMLWGLGIFVVLLIATSFFSAQNNRTRINDIAQRQLQLEQLKVQVAQLEQQRPKSNLAELDAQSLQLAQELSRREQIYQVIANKNLGNNTGFSAHLQALGRQSLETLSLQAFSLLAGGNYLEFAGAASAVDQIPLYVQRLRSETVFSQSAFGVLNAEPQEDEFGVFNFSLAKQAENTKQEESKTAVQMLIELNAAAKDKSMAGQN